ncbi:MAG: zinc-ribbon domain [Candidatus Atribacteria bacterium]|jgi:hypothetical protein|uniref:zinc ribbon domain-containing protein n=1 Tax=Atrimonas thermophila TaxID=3064161 RepID=UPI0024ABD269|nr:zinc-ribbon domain [Candidatus Atribacteria bacterium]
MVRNDSSRKWWQILSMFLKLRSLYRERRKSIEELGAKVYELYRKNELDTEKFKEYCQKVLSLEEEIEEIKEKLLSFKREKIFCKSCGQDISPEMSYCPYCGTPQKENPERRNSP